ncbi:MAG TPA: hypothetical protein VND95_15235 [Stellaceae bacterium]|nr:hypothetical protein [Stellaceae bacterium]
MDDPTDDPVDDPGQFGLETYQAFRRRALDPALSRNEKCGFTETVRAGQSERIFADIRTKLPALDNPGSRVLDIGAGCSDLAHHIVAATGRRGQSLSVIDSPEMLALLPDSAHLEKIAGPFPQCLASIRQATRPFDAILAYSVAQHVFAEGDLFAFVDAAVQLLADAGRFLVGDIPNASLRRRFLASASGRADQLARHPHSPDPGVRFNALDVGQIDDGVVIGLLVRMRLAGLQAFVVPQGEGLPMANRREDLLIARP